MKLQCEYSKSGSYIQLCLPIETEVLIPVDHKVRLLDQVFETLDYRKLYRSFCSHFIDPCKPRQHCLLLFIHKNRSCFATLSCFETAPIMMIKAFILLSFAPQ